MQRRPEYVWLIDENVRGEVLSHGAHVSLIRYFHMKMWWEEFRDNSDFNYIGEEGNDDED